MYFFEDKKIGAMHERLSREREVNNVKESATVNSSTSSKRSGPETSTLSLMKMLNPAGS